MNYLKVFKNIKSSIEAHPYLEITECEINKGLSKEELKKAKKKLYKSLDYYKTVKLGSIFKFYKQCNGVTIKWKISSHLDEETYNNLPGKFPNLKLPFDRDLDIGSINILPFDDVFINEQNYFDKSNSGDNFTQFGDYTYEGNSFGKMLFLFDLYSDTDCMAFVADQDNEKPKVIYLSDRYIIWDHSKISFFDSYINFLAATRGLTQSKEEYFDHYRGDKLEPLIFDSIPYETDVEPSIFKKK